LDQAFASRIHISLPYPQLDLITTLEVFKLNIRLIQDQFKKKSLRLRIDWDDIMQFAQAYWTNNEAMRWNGRQIRNNCRTALALAESEAQGRDYGSVVHTDVEVRLEVEHFYTVSRTHLEFNSYLTDVQGTDSESRAGAYTLRGRETEGRVELNVLLPHI
jgi:hypothetical protein